MSGFRGKSCWLTRVLATVLVVGAAFPAAVWHHHEPVPACDALPAATDACHPERSTPAPHSHDDQGSCHLCLAAHLVATASPTGDPITFEEPEAAVELPVLRAPASRVLGSLQARAPPA